MAIRVFITGGTFDKTYDEISGKLLFEDTHIHEMLGAEPPAHRTEARKRSIAGQPSGLSSSCLKKT